MGEVEVNVSKEAEKKVEEFNEEFQNLLGKILETHDTSILMQSVMVMMGQLIQTIMLINFKCGGYLTSVEQGEILDTMVHMLLKKTYSTVVEQVNETHAEWFDKKTKH